MFKQGDIVRCIEAQSEELTHLQIDAEYIVDSVYNGWVFLLGKHNDNSDNGSYAIERFELVEEEKEKPALKFRYTPNTVIIPAGTSASLNVVQTDIDMTTQNISVGNDKTTPALVSDYKGNPWWIDPVNMTMKPAV